jgi:hypothetical protein
MLKNWANVHFASLALTEAEMWEKIETWGGGRLDLRSL